MTNVKKIPYRIVHLSIPVWIVLALEFGLWLWSRFRFEHAHYEPWGAALWGLVVSVVAIVASFQILNLLLLERPRARTIFNVLLVLLYLTLIAFHLVAEHSLDFYFLGDNFALLFYPESVAMAANGISFEQMLTGVNVLLVLVALLTTTQTFSRWPEPKCRLKNLAAHLLLLGVILGTSLYRHNELTFFTRTAADYSMGRYTYPGFPVTEKYPYVHPQNEVSDDKTIGPRPHVFLILMESFNANFVESKTDDGREFTPVFNQRLQEGLFVERFYGNSIQTARAHLPTLCSVLSSYWGKVATTYPKLRLRSIVQIVREQGYQTLFFRGQQTLAFDRAGEFMKKIGFDETYCMDEQFAGDDAHEFSWSMGFQDNKTYEKVFQHLDKIYTDEPPSDSKNQSPSFVMIATISHHYPFDSIPEDQRYLYPEPANRKEHFANSIHLADKYLARFFQELESREYLKDSLVVICGDHSFPAGEHGNYYNENRFYEENFRIPLLVWWPGKLSPQRIQETSHSQLDIPPTLLDLLEIETAHHFQGNSILDPQTASAHAIPLIQPYDGTHLCVVKYPYKYVESVRVPGRYLYRLDSDPQEEHNVIAKYEGSPILAELQQEVKRIQLNQYLIERNRIWPPADEL